MKDLMCITINPNGVRRTVKIQEAIDKLTYHHEVKKKPGGDVMMDPEHVQARERYYKMMEDPIKKERVRTNRKAYWAWRRNALNGRNV